MLSEVDIIRHHAFLALPYIMEIDEINTNFHFQFVSMDKFFVHRKCHADKQWEARVGSKHRLKGKINSGSAA